MKQKKAIGAILVVIVFAIVGVGCYRWASATKNRFVENEKSMGVLAQKTKEKYQKMTARAGQSEYDFKEPINDIRRQDEICLQLGFDAMSADVTYWKEMYGLFFDKKLQKEVTVAYEWDEKEKVLHMSPNGNGANQISVGGLDTGIVKKYPHSKLFLYDTDVPQWGNVNTLYLASYYDEQTGEKLANPTVRVVNLVGELPDEPKLEYTISEDGRLCLNWTPVKGAENYIICVAQQKEYGYNSVMTPIAHTTECRWTSELPKMDALTMNDEFKYFDFGEDDWVGENYTEERLALFRTEYPKECEKKAVINFKRDFEEQYLCVVAVSKVGNSMPSNMIKYSQLASNLPYAQAIYTQKENGLKSSDYYPSIKELPLYTYIEMCDGRVFKKLYNYAIDEATVSFGHLYVTNDDGEVVEREDTKYLNVPYSIDGTGFIGVMVVQDYDEANLEADLRTIEEMEKNMRMKGGSVLPSMDSGVDQGEDEIKETGKKDKFIEADEELEKQVFANSALSEYLAINLVAGNTIISLADFPEAASDEILMDAFCEAYYQNPMVLGVDRYGTALNNQYVIVTYQYEQKDRERMQKEIREKVKEIVPQIIKEDMSDAEKEMAINAYLCGHTEYDYDAYESAKANGFKDTPYSGAFNAYGALILGKCVCQGYADAFQLLARESGLSSILVTGMLDGEVPHAWNKVKIDGEWCVLDTTNNDGDYLTNALFNVPAFVSDKVLVEDSSYLLDDYIPDYELKSEEYEYYHLTDRFYQVDSVVSELVEQLEASDNGKVILRTDYQITDADFRLILRQVDKKISGDKSIAGAYWLGVIYIQFEDAEN